MEAARVLLASCSVIWVTLYLYVARRIAQSAQLKERISKLEAAERNSTKALLEPHSNLYRVGRAFREAKKRLNSNLKRIRKRLTTSKEALKKLEDPEVGCPLCKAELETHAHWTFQCLSFFGNVIKDTRETVNA